MKMHLFQPRQVAVSKGIPYVEAVELMHKTPGQTKFWVYHYSCEGAAVGFVSSKDEITDEWECPECQRSGIASEVSFEEFKIIEEAA